jgi:hypothetical protein
VNAVNKTHPVTRNAIVFQAVVKEAEQYGQMYLSGNIILVLGTRYLDPRNLFLQYGQRLVDNTSIKDALL